MQAMNAVVQEEYEELELVPFSLAPNPFSLALDPCSLA